MLQVSERLGELLLAKQWLLATVESCTAGGLASCVASVPGASQWFDGGFVTYSNEAKMTMLDLPEVLLREHGAVSEAVAKAMAESCLARTRASIALSTTGVAGPGGGTPEKPVGLVYVAIALPNAQTHVRRLSCSGSRSEIQNETIETLLAWACEHLE